MSILWLALGAIAVAVSLIAAVWTYAAVKILLEMRAQKRLRTHRDVLHF